MISQADLILTCKMGEQQLGQLLAGRSWRDALLLRRELQVAMTEFARHHSSKDHDHIKMGFITITQRIERACRDKFIRNRVKKLSRLDATFAHRDPSAIKGQAKQEFEIILKEMSY